MKIVCFVELGLDLYLPGLIYEAELVPDSYRSQSLAKIESLVELRFYYKFPLFVYISEFTLFFDSCEPFVKSARVFELGRDY